MSSSISSHLMKTTRRGRPFVKDAHDLFCTLMVSLNFDTHRNFFKTYPNSFTTDDACSNLGALKFSQSTRAADSKDPTRIVTTTTTTTFSMSREMAKGICQHFMDCHLVENATDIMAGSFKDRAIYMLTSKGLHILERFVSKNGIAADHLLKIFATQPITMKLLHLERRSADDEIIITRSVIEVLFRRFIGRVPNLTKLNDDEILAHYYSRFYTKASPLPAGETLDRSEGIIMRKPGAGEKTASSDDYVFSARAAVDWMLDFTSATSIDEAAEILGQFVRYGLIAFVSDKGKIREENVIISVRGGGAGGGAGAVMQEAEFRVTERAIYKVTKEGIAVAKWNEPTNNHAATASKANLHADVTPGNKTRPSHEASASVSVQRRTSLSDRFRSDFDISGVPGGDNHNKDSHTARLKQILEEPALRSLFREFLRSNFCEENLSFWLDVQDFKRRFQTTSSAVAAPGSKQAKLSGHATMEKHQQDLIAMAFVIYNSYLAPASPCELNIDHNLRAELVAYMNQITADKEAGVKGHIEPGIGNTLHASQLQTMVKLYERIQVYIFRLMATDSVPKFCKTELFLTLTQQFSEYEKDESAIAGLEAKTAALVIDSRKTATHVDGRAPSPTRAYLTISQAANEKQAAKQKH
uniref:Crg1 n=1 Tax=Cryptococcus gattii TaxID=552467 RepID=Q6VTF1_CRYGA|nr:Crg1 [Cryptococcus bacillisporus]